jgi:hypothetical protein
MEEPWIRTWSDHRMGIGGIKPSCGVMIPKPLRDKNGVVCHTVANSQQRVHFGRLLADVIVVDAV